MDDDWEFDFRVTPPERRMVDGSLSTKDLLMRRKRPDGKYDYRLPTEAEELDFALREAW